MKDRSNFGAILQSTREGFGWSLEDVAHRTRIPLAILGQLESNDYSKFPSPAYAKSFFAQYADYLELDSADLLDSLEAEAPFLPAKTFEYQDEYTVRVKAKPLSLKRSKRKKKKESPAAAPVQEKRPSEHPASLQPLLVFSTTAVLITATFFAFVRLSSTVSEDTTAAPEPEEVLAPIGGLSTQTASAPKFANVPRALPVTSDDNLVAGDPSTSAAEPLGASATQSEAPIEFSLDNPPPRAIIIEE